jgi:uncharacterized membrane protein (UPF0127 family)
MKCSAKVRFWLVGAWLVLFISAGTSAFAAARAATADPQSAHLAGSGEPAATTPEFDRMQERGVELVNDEGQLLSVVVRIAEDPLEQTAGFQFIAPEVIERSLILFVFADEHVGRFHMRNVRAPLDIAFIARDGAIIDIQRMQPDPKTTGPFGRTYGPDKPFQYALEARAGFFLDLHVSAGKSRLRAIPE